MSAHARKSFPATPARRRRHRIHSDLPAVFRAGLRPDQLQHSFAHAAVVQRCRCRGARAAIAVDPSDAGYGASPKPVPGTSCSHAWTGCRRPGERTSSLVPVMASTPTTSAPRRGSRSACSTRNGDPGKAIIPVLSFPGIGAIPNLPQTLKASANLLL